MKLSATMNMGTYFTLLHFIAFLILIFMACSNTLIVEAQRHRAPDVKKGKFSPAVSGHKKAILTINDFRKGGGGGDPSECSGKYYDNSIPIVALSTGWYSKGKRCFEKITIYANGKSTKAVVVDECNTSKGCRNNIVDASEAVWKALGVPKKDWGWLEIFWSD
ncbi:putative ripening-related protein 2 [Nicotiana tabacum]|uniref:Ripening-related protein 2 n=3 Tax=Nicotiana TaxID=4085 RepID=A0A1S3XPN5_TOBAC|nr:PREDICTED: putative ripening-related protein 2 [Nicotiana sylvestris]XP_016441617.1 PREDICTED: putative ripening-related protein 2 [Nicotiana tabacum]